MRYLLTIVLAIAMIATVETATGQTNEAFEISASLATPQDGQADRDYTYGIGADITYVDHRGGDDLKPVAAFHYQDHRRANSMTDREFGISGGLRISSGNLYWQGLVGLTSHRPAGGADESASSASTKISGALGTGYNLGRFVLTATWRISDHPTDNLAIAVAVRL